MWLSQVFDDWVYMSLIFDRLLLYIYAIVTLAGTMSIIVNAPHIFTDFEQQAFKHKVALETMLHGELSVARRKTAGMSGQHAIRRVQVRVLGAGRQMGHLSSCTENSPDIGGGDRSEKF